MRLGFLQINMFSISELTVLGDLKLEGLLMENNKPRIVLLFKTMLIITKKKEDNRLQFKTYIHVSSHINIAFKVITSIMFLVRISLFHC